MTYDDYGYDRSDLVPRRPDRGRPGLIRRFRDRRRAKHRFLAAVQAGPVHTIDVTRIVQEWAGGPQPHAYRAEVLANAGRPSERWTAAIMGEDRDTVDEAREDADHLVREGYRPEHVRIAQIISLPVPDGHEGGATAQDAAYMVAALKQHAHEQEAMADPASLIGLLDTTPGITRSSDHGGDDA